MNNYSTFTYISNALDQVFNDNYWSNSAGNYLTSSSTGPIYYSQLSGISEPCLKIQTWDEILKTDYDFKSIDAPKYPKSSCYITEDGTVIIELAVTGFNKKDIKVKREGEKIIVSGDKEKEESKLKEVWNNISKKKFETIFNFNDRMNLDTISISMENGILQIKVPLKEENKPIVKDLEIK